MRQRQINQKLPTMTRRAAHALQQEVSHLMDQRFQRSYAVEAVLGQCNISKIHRTHCEPNLCNSRGMMADDEPPPGVGCTNGAASSLPCSTAVTDMTGICWLLLRVPGTITGRWPMADKPIRAGSSCSACVSFLSFRFSFSRGLQDGRPGGRMKSSKPP